MKPTTLAAVAGVALLVSTISLVVTLIQIPASRTDAGNRDTSFPVTISGGSLFIGSAHPWSYDARSHRMRYGGQGAANHLKVVLGHHLEEMLTREPSTRFGVKVVYGNIGLNRTLLLESDREGRNLELTLSDQEKRVDPAYLQVLPNLLRDPSLIAKVTSVIVEGCRRASGENVQPYQVNEEGIALSLQFEP